MKKLLLPLLLLPLLLWTTYAEASEPESQILQSREHSFQVSFPKAWRALPKFGPRVVFHFGGLLYERQATFSVTVSEDWSFRAMTTEDYIKTQNQKDLLTMLSMNFKEPKINRWEPKYNLGGQPALMFIYSGKLDGVKQASFTIQTIRTGKLYTLNFNAAADDLPAIFLELTHIADSFKFSPAP